MFLPQQFDLFVLCLGYPSRQAQALGRLNFVIDLNFWEPDPFSVLSDLGIGRFALYDHDALTRFGYSYPIHPRSKHSDLSHL